MSKPVAIVTGGASGIGLACTKRLLERGYKVAIADLNTNSGEKVAAELGPDVLFQYTDVAKYEDQAALFKKVFEWGGGRLDFLAANAGVDDRQNLYQLDHPLDEAGSPKPLNLKTIDVDVNAVFQGMWLFRYYARKGNNPGGKIVITSSMAGLYHSPINPQYMAAKHACVGLARSAGPIMLKTENISVNAICPAFVVTGLCPPEVLAIFPKEHITPMETVINAYDAILDDDSLTGQIIEASLDQIYYREQPGFANASQKWICVDSLKLWEQGYEEPPKRK